MMDRLLIRLWEENRDSKKNLFFIAHDNDQLFFCGHGFWSFFNCVFEIILTSRNNPGIIFYKGAFMKKPSDEIIRNLNYLRKTYDGTVKLLVSTKNRLKHLNPEAEAKHQDEIMFLESLRGKLSRRIIKELAFFPIWEKWLSKIPGIGPFIAGNLILLYYFRFTAICSKCGDPVEKKEHTFYCSTCDKSIKGDGIIKHRIDEKEFSNVSKFWKYLGLHCDDSGNKPKLKKGVVCKWSNKGRAVCYQIGEAFIKFAGDHLYRDYYDGRKKKHELKHPDKPKNKADVDESIKYWTKGHRHNAAKNETAKLLVSHFWHVARELAGKSTRGVYADVVLAHTGIIAPYYWEGSQKVDEDQDTVASSQKVQEKKHGTGKECINPQSLMCKPNRE